jgi:hypothetical protein
MAALARNAGLRNAGDRVRAALANGEIEGDRRGATMWAMRNRFEAWLNSALADDKADDSLMLKIDQARALAAAAGLRGSSARVLTAVTNGEINGCFKDTSGWWIPRAGFDEWLRFVCAEGAEVDDGSVTVSEAAALAAAYGLRGFRSELLAACIEGDMPGAYRDGATWRIPLASVKQWIADINAQVAAALYVEPERQKSWWDEWKLAIGLWVFAVLLWCWVLRL